MNRLNYLLVFENNLGIQREELTDEEDVNECGYFRRKTSFGIKIHGNVVVYVGKTFKTEEKQKEHPYFRSKADNSILSEGKIEHIVSHRDDPTNLWFSFYDCQKFRRPPTSADDWHYARCEDFLAKKLKLISWKTQALLGEELVGRKVCIYFGGKYKRFYKGKIVKYTRGNKEPYDVLFEDNEIHSFNQVKILQCLRI